MFVALATLTRLFRLFPKAMVELNRGERQSGQTFRNDVGIDRSGPARFAGQLDRKEDVAPLSDVKVVSNLNTKVKGEHHGKAVPGF